MTGHGTFRKLGERSIYEGAFISLATGRFETPEGDEIERDIVHHPGAVAVVPVIDDSIVMVRQYRAAIDDWLLEIPAGKRDIADEAPATTAARELAEEIGYRAGRLSPLADFHLTPGFCDELLHLFIGEDLEAVATDHQGVEERHMSIERVPFAAVPGLITAGELADAKSIVGCLLALRRAGS